tara:strand:+ start:1356 stop:2201 length:846 start_codon:yes stop_codon:yes gene_type:complete
MIISGSASTSLAASLSSHSKIPLGKTTHQFFPDGEFMVQTNFQGDHGIIVAATRSASDHLELLQLQDAVREAGATNITTILPYMGYARQDTVFESGQPLSARAMARSIGTGTDKVIIVNPHKNIVCDYFGVPAIALDASSVLAQTLPPDLENPLFLSPDSGAISLAESIRDSYGGGDTDYFEKKRISSTEVHISPNTVDVTGRDVICVDDIISTGTTTSKSASILRDRGAKKIFVTCVHAILIAGARKMLSDSGVDAIYTTDTIVTPETKVSVAPLLAKLL